jgi:hypothetical protein
MIFGLRGSGSMITSAHSMERNFSAVNLLNKCVRNKFDEVHLSGI